MFDTVGHNAYYILMGINIISLTVIVLFWPETKGISLEHMSRLFGEVDAVQGYDEKVSWTQHVEEDDPTHREAPSIS